MLADVMKGVCVLASQGKGSVGGNVDEMVVQLGFLPRRGKPKAGILSCRRKYSNKPPRKTRAKNGCVMVLREGRRGVVVFKQHSIKGAKGAIELKTFSLEPFFESNGVESGCRSYSCVGWLCR